MKQKIETSLIFTLIHMEEGIALCDEVCQSQQWYLLAFLKKVKRLEIKCFSRNIK